MNVKLLLFILFLLFKMALMANEKVLNYSSWRQGRILFEKAKLEQLVEHETSKEVRASIRKQMNSVKNSRKLDVIDYYEIYLSTRFRSNERAIHKALQQLTDRQKTKLVMHLQKQ